MSLLGDNWQTYIKKGCAPAWVLPIPNLYTKVEQDIRELLIVTNAFGIQMIFPVVCQIICTCMYCTVAPLNFM